VELERRVKTKDCVKAAWKSPGKISTLLLYNDQTKLEATTLFLLHAEAIELKAWLPYRDPRYTSTAQL
jgi:hypothetical protein